MLGNTKPKGGKPQAPPPPPMEVDGDDRMTAEDIARAFNIPEQLFLPLNEHGPNTRLVNVPEIYAVELLEKWAQWYLDEMNPGKFTVTVSLK